MNDEMTVCSAIGSRDSQRIVQDYRRARVGWRTRIEDGDQKRRSRGKAEEEQRRKKGKKEEREGAGRNGGSRLNRFAHTDSSFHFASPLVHSLLFSSLLLSSFSENDAGWAQDQQKE